MKERTDNLTRAQRRRTMKRVKSANTTPELLVRRLVHGMGFRYRLHRRDLPGAPDLVFAGRRKIIFVHGCFWHGHDCKSGRKRPKTNQGYWSKKLDRNKARDAENQLKLKELGWKVLIVWECEMKDRAALKAQLERFLDKKSDL
ncbi:MAG: DNA mismatch endonuclease Vsr [Desulfobacterales bacterium]|nr:DNA mismatch endonuclease Vsr [Desulfobacterales bacterium]